MAEPKFSTADQYEEYKEDHNQCLVKGCTHNQTDDDTLCDTHLDDDGVLFKECDFCHIPVPMIVEFCEFHNGISYTSDMKQRLLDAVKPIDTTLLGKLKSDAKEVFPKVALNSFVKATRAGLVTLLKKMNIDSPTMDKIIKFMDSDLGELLYKIMLSGGLSMVPDQFGGINTEALASQLRKQAMTDLGDSVFGMLVPALGIVLKEMATSDKETHQLEKIDVTNLDSLFVEKVVNVTETVGASAR